MSILNARNLSIQYGTQASPFFEGVSFEINERDKIGLIGPNGCGKTTLLRILLGKACADSGHVHLGHHVRIGYYAQEHEDLDPDRTILFVSHDRRFIERIADEIVEVGTGQQNLPPRHQA